MRRAKYTWALLAASAGLSTIVVGTGVAQAAPAPRQVAVSRASGQAAHAVPNADIAGAGSKAVFKPSSLSAKYTPRNKSCTSATAGFAITNTTAVTQTITFGGSPEFAIAAGQRDAFCLYGSGSRTVRFGLESDPVAKLSIHVS